MLRIISIIGFILLVLTPLGAHPHMYIDASVRLLEKPGQLNGIRLKWHFDLGFTSMVLESFDEDKNKILDSKEIKAIEQEAFSYIVDKHWYTRIFLNRKELAKLPLPLDFTARVDNKGLLFYEFTLPLKIELQEKAQELWLFQYDEEFFVDMAFAKEPLSSDTSPRYHHVTSQKLITEKAFAYWEGSISPKRLTLEIKAKQ